MYTDITFLHTAEIHIETFSRLIEKYENEFSIKHIVRCELLENAINNGINERFKNELQGLVVALAEQCQLVVCSCSTLGSIVEAVQLNNGKEAIRIDRAMANHAVKLGNKILVLATLESTLRPTQQLIESSQLNMGTNNVVDYIVAGNSWKYFLAGSQKRYLQTIADIINDKQHNYDCIVLAQASMVGAIDMIKQKGPPVLSSPEIGVDSMINKLIK